MVATRATQQKIRYDYFSMPIPDRMNPTFGNVRTPELDPLEEAAKRLIVALDVPRAAAAEDLVNRLERSCHWFKVGM